jgi:hypothetical protein
VLWQSGVEKWSGGNGVVSDQRCVARGEPVDEMFLTAVALADAAIPAPYRASMLLNAATNKRRTAIGPDGTRNGDGRHSSRRVCRENIACG